MKPYVLYFNIMNMLEKHLFHIGYNVYHQMFESAQQFFSKLKFRVNLSPTHGLTPCKVLSN